jgi:hypothetical protein
MRDRHGLAPESPLSPKGGVVLGPGRGFRIALCFLLRSLTPPANRRSNRHARPRRRFYKGALLAVRIQMHFRSVGLTGGRYLSVEPILFIGQRAPSGLHSLVPAIGRVID